MPLLLRQMTICYTCC